MRKKKAWRLPGSNEFSLSGKGGSLSGRAAQSCRRDGSARIGTVALRVRNIYIMQKKKFLQYGLNRAMRTLSFGTGRRNRKCKCSTYE